MKICLLLLKKSTSRLPAAGISSTSVNSFSPRIILNSPCLAEPLSYMKSVASFDDGLMLASPQCLEF